MLDNNYQIEEVIKEVPSYNIKMGSNIYYNSDGNKVPRVTHILSETLDQSSLIRWANRIGLQHQLYDSILNKAADIGSEAHGYIEEYIKMEMDQSISPNIDMENIPFNGFLMWYNIIRHSHKVKPLYSEYTMYNEYFGGTLDLLLEIDGKVFLVDFKTSNYVSEKYFLQLAAYRMLIYQNLGISINGCIILQLNKETVGYNEYLLNFEDDNQYNFIEECYRAFLALVYAYYNAHYIKERYNEIFKKGRKQKSS